MAFCLQWHLVVFVVAVRTHLIKRRKRENALFFMESVYLWLFPYSSMFNMALLLCMTEGWTNCVIIFMNWPIYCGIDFIAVLSLSYYSFSFCVFVFVLFILLTTSPYYTGIFLNIKYQLSIMHCLLNSLQIKFLYSFLWEKFMHNQLHHLQIKDSFLTFTLERT